MSEDVAPRMRAEKPRTLSWLAYLDESGTSISFIHVFADSQAMDLHMEGVWDRAKASSDFMEPRGWEIYGAPSESALAQTRGLAAAAGVALRLEPDLLAGGFLRLSSGAPG